VMAQPGRVIACEGRRDVQQTTKAFKPDRIDRCILPG
jgi:5S rRNA maturation endonuclease (ribonuclease M5)